MDKEKFLKKRTEWKNFHSAILFSMLNPNHETSSPDVLKGFLDFVKMPEKARDSFLADFDFLEFLTNNRQTILLIKNKKYGTLVCFLIVARLSAEIETSEITQALSYPQSEYLQAQCTP